MARVAFLGPPGTFTEEALLSQPDLAEQELVPCRSIPEVIGAVEADSADLGVVPIENSIEGSVNATLDTLAFGSTASARALFVQREMVLGITLNLCARPGTHLEDIRTVVSYPHASAQCREWLAAKLPEARVAAANSTADAAREVARSRRPGMAAVGTALAATLYGLEIVATAVEDRPGNQTRFVVVGRDVAPPSGHDKTSVVCFQSQDRPGSLLGILQEFAARAINLTKLESRPTKRGLGEYCFFIDFDGHVADELVADALRNLAAKSELKFLGSYPVVGSDHGDAQRKAAGEAWRQASVWVEGLRASIRGHGTPGLTG
ncbi:MAG: prephenate dehydratase [Acidimicrobiia bacterium]